MQASLTPEHYDHDRVELVVAGDWGLLAYPLQTVPDAPSALRLWSSHSQQAGYYLDHCFMDRETELSLRTGQGVFQGTEEQ